MRKNHCGEKQCVYNTSSEINVCVCLNTYIIDILDLILACLNVI